MDDQVVSEAFVPHKHYSVNCHSFNGDSRHSPLPYAFNWYSPYCYPHDNSHFNEGITLPSYSFNYPVTDFPIPTTEDVPLLDYQLHTSGQHYHGIQFTFGHDWNGGSNDVVLNNDIKSQPAVGLSQSLDNLKWHSENAHPNVYSEAMDLINDLRANPGVDNYQSHSENSHSLINDYGVPANVSGRVFLDNLEWHNESYHQNVHSDDKISRNDLRTEPDVDNYQSRYENIYANVLNDYDVLANAYGSTFLGDLKWHLENDQSSVQWDDKGSIDLEAEPKVSNELLICDPCGKSFKKNIYFKWHLKTLKHIENTQRTALTQNVEVVNNSSLPHIEETQRNALTQNVEFANNSSLPHIEETQRNALTQNVENITKTSECVVELKCDTCDRSFKRTAYLTQHINAHHSTHRGYKCGKCGKRFVTENNLNEHFARHFGVKPFLCTQQNCDKSFNYSGDLKRHALKHTKELYYCSDCGKGFPNLRQLESHRKINLKKKERKKKNITSTCSLNEKQPDNVTYEAADSV